MVVTGKAKAMNLLRFSVYIPLEVVFMVKKVSNFFEMRNQELVLLRVDGVGEA
jgi:hypothetical protein